MVIDIRVYKVVKKFLNIQYSLCYVLAVVVDTAVGIQSQTQFLVNSNMRSPKLGTALFAQSKVLLGMAAGLYLLSPQ